MHVDTFICIYIYVERERDTYIDHQGCKQDAHRISNRVVVLPWSRQRKSPLIKVGRTGDPMGVTFFLFVLLLFFHKSYDRQTLHTARPSRAL